MPDGAERGPALLIVIASTRPGRVGLPVGRWFEERARAHGRFRVTVVDLAELRLPLMDEPNHPPGVALQAGRPGLLRGRLGRDPGGSGAEGTPHGGQALPARRGRHDSVRRPAHRRRRRARAEGDHAAGGRGDARRAAAHERCPGRPAQLAGGRLRRHPLRLEGRAPARAAGIRRRGPYLNLLDVFDGCTRRGRTTFAAILDGGVRTVAPGGVEYSPPGAPRSTGASAIHLEARRPA